VNRAANDNFEARTSISSVLHISDSVGYQPCIKVKILSNEFSELLDTGSSISIIGNNVLDLVKQRGIKCDKSIREVKFLKGSIYTTEVTTLTVTYAVYHKRHKFVIVNESFKPILLGRDLITNINWYTYRIRRMEYRNITAKNNSIFTTTDRLNSKFTFKRLH